MKGPYSLVQQYSSDDSIWVESKYEETEDGGSVRKLWKNKRTNEMFTYEGEVSNMI